MDALELIHAVDAMRPNGIGTDQKVRWLSRCDGQILEHLEENHHINRKRFRPFHGEIEADALCAPMMVREPYQAIYEYYLMAQIDLVNGDMARYNNDMILYNSALSDFCKAFHRRCGVRRKARFRI